MAIIEANQALKDLDTTEKVDKTTRTELEWDGDTKTDKWDGKLVIDGYTALTKINLTGNVIDELIIRNCPKLTDVDLNDNEFVKINVSETKLDPSNNKPVANEIKIFTANKNTLKEINLENCKNLEQLALDNCGTIEIFKGGNDIDENLKQLNYENTKGLAFTSTTNLKELKDVKEAVDQILGSGNTPTKTGPGGKPIIDISKLQDDLKDKGAETSPKAKEVKEALNEIGGTELGLTGNDITKDNIVAKVKEMKEKLAAIVSELGLSNNATKQEIINKIKELKNRGPACSHTDYDAIKAERDKLKTENANLKSKENSNPRKVLADIINTSWKDLGIKVSDNKKTEIQNARTVEEMERLQNGVIKSEISKLKDENSSAFNLNIALGILTVGSWIILAWVVMRNANLPKTEPNSEKEKKQLKK